MESKRSERHKRGKRKMVGLTLREDEITVLEREAAKRGISTATLVKMLLVKETDNFKSFALE